jgi:hypothetical protein
LKPFMLIILEYTCKLIWSFIYIHNIHESCISNLVFVITDYDIKKGYMKVVANVLLLAYYFHRAWCP